MKVPGGAGSDPVLGALRILGQAHLPRLGASDAGVSRAPDATPRMSVPSGIDAMDTPRIQGPADPGADPRLREATVALEGVFARELVKALRGTVPEGGSPDAPGGQLFTSLLDDHLADVLAGENGLGLSSAMLKQLMGGADSGPGGS